MQAYWRDTSVGAQGDLRLDGLPFAPGEPVEVLVNHCPIARGEVVVVEGNYGVRIQQIISRQERIRSLR